MNFRNILNNRAQMEIIGLVIIVILISLGMIFLMIFALNSSSRQQVPVHRDIANSAMNSLIQMTVDDDQCYLPGTRQDLRVPLSFGREILEDCADGGRELYHCEGMNSCDFFEKTTQQILAETIQARGNRYEMRIWVVQGGEREPLQAFYEGPAWKIRNEDPEGLLGGQGCPKGIVPVYSSNPYQLTILGGPRIETQLLVC